MGSGKQPEISEPSDSASLAGRIVDSVNALARAAFAQPSAATNSLASLSENASKVESSSSTTRNREECSTQEASTNVLTSLGNSTRAALHNSFRSVSCGDQRQIQEEFDDFTSPPESAARNATPLDHSGKTCSGSLALDLEELPIHRSLEGNASHNKRHEGSKQSNYSDNDGAAVVELLSCAGFSADEEPTEVWEQENRNLKGLLGDGGTSHDHNGRLASPLDLIPDYELHHAGNGSHPWHDVLNRYHDEVWGDKLPLVQEARKELKQAIASRNENPDNRPALRRLKMLLQHVKPLD